MKEKNKEVTQQEQVVKVAQKEETTQEKKAKKSLVEEYKDFRQAVLKVGIVFLYVVIAIPVCISIAYDNSIKTFGDGPVNYTEDAYDIMKEALEGPPQDDVEENLVVKSDDDTEEKIEPCLVENIGLDIKRFRSYVTDYELHSEGENTILNAWITKGSFKAEIEVTMDENYHVTETKRNYESKQQYMDEFYDQLRWGSIFNGGVLFVYITIALFASVSAVMFIVEKCSKIKEHKKEKKQKKDKEQDSQKQYSVKEKENPQKQDSVNKEETAKNDSTEKSDIVSISDKIPDSDKRPEASA